MKWIILYSVSFIAACGNNNSVKEDPAIAADTMQKPVVAVEGNAAVVTDSLNAQIDTVIHVRFAPDSSSVTVSGHLNRKGDPVICYIPIKKGKRLYATVIPENGKANIRISHILMPNGVSDGPFGQTVEYKLSGEGLYRLFIGPNRMAGDPVATDFRVRIKVQ